MNATICGLHSWADPPGAGCLAEAYGLILDTLASGDNEGKDHITHHAYMILYQAGH